MQSSIFALVAFGMLLAFAQGVDVKSVSEFVIKQGMSLSFYMLF
jgi:hypothetical protein